MEEQPRYDPLDPSDFFDNRMSARPIVPNTIPRGHLRLDRELYTGRRNDELVTELPVELTRDLLQRGQLGYKIYCAPCHDRVGTGKGMVVQSGFPEPPDLHIRRLREAPIGHYFDVITNGFGRMPDYAQQVPPRERWAIAAYIRALQLSQHANVDELPDDLRRRLSDAAQNAAESELPE